MRASVMDRETVEVSKTDLQRAYACDLCTEAGGKILFDVKNPFIYHVSMDQGDIDDQGHVNNVSYVKWMEEAAMAHSNWLGYDWQRYQKIGASFFVRRHEIEYLAQSYLEDPIIIATWPDKMERFTALRRYQIIRASDGETLVRAKTTWIYMSMHTERPVRMSEEMIDKFLQSVR